MRSAVAAGAALFVGWSLVAPAPAADAPPKMEFGQVKEIAPGVFFRYSAISATDKSVVFGGSNNTWVVFQDYVVVIDANFPEGAEQVIEAVKKTTDKPIRYVFDTHHHGDHAYGNAVFDQLGAGIIATANCARLLRIDGPKQFEEAGKGPNGRKDVAESTLKVPNVIFDDKLVLDDGTQRIEFLFLGHAHTAGDAVAYLPKQKILCTGDACVNGAFNFLGHSDTASWIRVLEKAQQLDVTTVCPGHGAMAGKDLLETQKRYFVDLRRIVKEGIAAGKTREEIVKNIDLPWYKEWTGVAPTGPNVEYVYDELTGRVAPWDLAEDYGVYEGPSPTKDSPGWKAPRKIVVPSGLMPARLQELKVIAPEVEFIPAKSAEDAAKLAEEADAVVGFCSPEIVKAGKKLRWIQLAHGDLPSDLSDDLLRRDLVLTGTAPVDGPSAAEQAFALLFELMNRANQVSKDGEWAELKGKTVLVVGLGGAGVQVARRAEGFGARVLAVDSRDMDRPSFVLSLDKPDRLMELLPKSDVVVLACPLPKETAEVLGPEQLDAMKPTAYLINLANEGLVHTTALMHKLQNHTLAGVGLAISDRPWPVGDPPKLASNLVVMPRASGQSPEAAERRWELFRENVRRFTAGEPLLCVVDK